MKVLYFAQAADAAGCREEKWDIPFPISMQAFWDEAIHRHPKLAGLKSQCRVASGMDYIADNGQLDPTQEAAVIPPVSGG